MLNAGARDLTKKASAALVEVPDREDLRSLASRNHLHGESQTMKI
jgi:hypothetical protein